MLAGSSRSAAPEFLNEGIAIRKQLTRHFGGARFAATRSGQQRGVGVVKARELLPDTAERDQHGTPVGQNPPSVLVMLGGEFKFIALFGQGSELEMRAEIIGAHLDGGLPALNSGGERRIDILEGLLGNGVAGLADLIEDATGLDLLLCLIAEKSVIERELGVFGSEEQRLLELLASALIFADFQVGVRQVLPNRRAIGGGLDSFEERGDGGFVIAAAEGVVGAREGLIGRIRRLGGSQADDDEEDGEPHVPVG